MAVEGQALGFVETVGLVAATEAADAMVKGVIRRGVRTPIGAATR
jgi:hypothetical protein